MKPTCRHFLCHWQYWEAHILKAIQQAREKERPCCCLWQALNLGGSLSLTWKPMDFLRLRKNLFFLPRAEQTTVLGIVNNADWYDIKPYFLLVRLDLRFNRNHLFNIIAGQKRLYIGFLANNKETESPGACSGKYRHAWTVITRVGCLNETQPIVVLTFIDQWLLDTSICGFTCIFFLSSEGQWFGVLVINIEWSYAMPWVWTWMSNRLDVTGSLNSISQFFLLSGCHGNFWTIWSQGRSSQRARRGRLQVHQSESLNVSLSSNVQVHLQSWFQPQANSTCPFRGLW